MIHLDNSGSAYEIGFQHGAAIPQSVRLACQAYGDVTSISQSRLEAGIRLLEQRLDRLFPEILEELQGIADGSGVTRTQILALNFYTAVVGYSIGNPGCSTIGFADSDVGVLLGKTADWNISDADQIALWQRYEPAAGEGYAFVHYGCAGTLWTEGGLNAAGLGMVLNGLPVTGIPPDGLPTAALTRSVLQHCQNVKEAICFLNRYDVIHWGFTLMLADAGEDLAFIEVVPGAQAVRRPEKDCLFHTNHCLCIETKSLELDDEGLKLFGEPELTRNSRARYKTLERIVPPAPRTLTKMQSLLRNRSDCGPISQRGEQGQYTVYAMLVAPVQNKIWGAEGYPPDVSFVKYVI